METTEQARARYQRDKEKILAGRMSTPADKIAMLTEVSAYLERHEELSAATKLRIYEGAIRLVNSDDWRSDITIRGIIARLSG